MYVTESETRLMNKISERKSEVSNLRELVEEKYKDVFEAAKEGEQRCFNGKRWGGHVVLIVVDATLDSIGLNHFR